MTSIKTIFIFSIVILFSCNTQTEKREKWIREHSHGIALSDTLNYNDLEFLDDLLKDKRIVFLGESGHGVAEYTLLKSRVIRYLHEKLDFNVLAFEVNSADAFAANYYNSFTNADSTIYNSISTLWHVEEIVPLFNYIIASHNSKDPIFVQGVDLTQSNASCAFSEFLYNLIHPEDPEYAEEIKYKDSLFSARGVAKFTN